MKKLEIEKMEVIQGGGQKECAIVAASAALVGIAFFGVGGAIGGLIALGCALQNY